MADIIQYRGVKMIQGLSEIVDAFARLNTADFSLIAVEVENRYEEQVFIKDAIDTGRFIQSISWHPSIQSAEVHSFEVDTSADPLVTYEGFVDQGTKFITPRYMARGAVESLYLGDVMDEIFGFQVFMDSE